MVKNLLPLALAGMAMIAPSSMSAQMLTRNAQGMKQGLAIEKPGIKTPLLTRQQAFKNRIAEKQSFGTRAEETMNWGYCSDPWSALPARGDIKVAVMMTKEIAANFAGNFISAIQVANPVDAKVMDAQYNYGNPSSDASVWISESLDGEPLAEGTGKLGKYGFEWSEIQLDSPLAIDGTKDLYIGYSVSVPNEEDVYGFVVDGMYPDSPYSAYLYSNLTVDNEGYFVQGEKSEWKEVGTWGGNACVRAVLTGDKLPHNYVSIEESQIPLAVTPGKEFPVTIGIVNDAANEVSKVSVTMQIGDAAPQTQECEIAVGLDEEGNYVMGSLNYGDYGLVETSFKYDGIGNNIPWTLSITKINGDADNNDKDALSGTMLSLKEGFAKTNVLEEATGLWCGYCVMGYAGMEWLKKNAPNFIGIATHGGDIMDVFGEGGAYNPFDGMVDGYPSAFLNRNWSQNVYPEPGNLADVVDEYSVIPAMAEIEAKIENLDDTNKKIRLTTTRRFSLAESNVKYSIGYTVVEDGLGPYPQTNYMSGEEGDYYGFQDMPNPVRLMFDDVALNSSHPTPVEGSVIEATEIGKDYEFSTEINLSDVTDLSKYRVVAYVLNGGNGAIENACQVLSPTYAGIEKVEAESVLAPIAFGGKGCIKVLSAGENISVMSLDGRTVAKRVSNGKIAMTPGIYIVTNGTRSAKVVVR